MRIKGIVLSLIIVSTSFFGAVACKDDGPGEKMGKKMDDTAKDVGNAVEDACEKVKEGVNAKDTDC